MHPFREPVLSLAEAMQTAQRLMRIPPEHGVLRAFTLHLSTRPESEELFRFSELALENGFQLHVGRPVYVDGPNGTVVFLYFVLWFFNTA